MVVTSAVLAPVNTELDIARSLFAVGDYDEVLALINPVIDDGNSDLESKCGALRLRSCVESERRQFSRSLETLRLAGPFIDNVSAIGQANFFGQRALVKRNLEDIDGAVVDYEAARYWAKEAGDEKIEAAIRNNLAKVYSDNGKVVEALSRIDGAIAIALRRDDDLNLGRYYDSRAQVLVDHSRPGEALAFSEKAIRQLGGLSSAHPALVEARATYGRALVALGVTYLESDDPIATFRARRKALDSISISLDRLAVETALARSNGHVLEAAKLLDVSHSALIRAIAKFALPRYPKRNRTKISAQ